jgi:soluble lytic murein transglycosylase-like protein
LVQESWSIGKKANLDPMLILAIIAIESSFNPFAQSTVGAQGLMQVMTQVHDEKYAAFGGRPAAFDPVTNLRVGAQVLSECIARAPAAAWRWA